MHNLFHLIDLKLSIFGALFLLINVSGMEISLKIIGSVLFIGYTARRWYLMERKVKEFKNKNEDDE
ncbi:hypothetical protein [Flavobacterium sp.]|uniref:hypothetical protein n=1 Tax=Flavobacterium sp. TaxID=239 RepID=UPI003D6BFC77